MPSLSPRPPPRRAAPSRPPVLLSLPTSSKWQIARPPVAPGRPAHKHSQPKVFSPLYFMYRKPSSSAYWSYTCGEEGETRWAGLRAAAARVFRRALEIASTRRSARAGGGACRLQGGHGGRQDPLVRHEEENGLLRRQLDALRGGATRVRRQHVVGGRKEAPVAFGQAAGLWESLQRRRAVRLERGPSV